MLLNVTIQKVQVQYKNMVLYMNRLLHWLNRCDSVLKSFIDSLLYSFKESIDRYGEGEKNSPL